jgi:hypothetical protein
MHAILLRLIALAILAMPIFADAEQSTPEKQTIIFKEKKEVTVTGPGDFTHRTGPTETKTTTERNFRLGPGETEIIKVQPGDKLEKRPGTKP